MGVSLPITDGGLALTSRLGENGDSGTVGFPQRRIVHSVLTAPGFVGGGGYGFGMCTGLADTSAERAALLAVEPVRLSNPALLEALDAAEAARRELDARLLELVAETDRRKLAVDA